MNTDLDAVMSLALNKTGRPIVYSLCNWGQSKSAADGWFSILILF